MLEFFKTVGRCTFGHGFWSTFYPLDIDAQALFKSWGFQNGDYYIFMKTCFGAILYFYKEKYYYLNPITGEYKRMMSRLSMAFDGFLLLDSIRADFMYDYYLKQRDRLPTLKYDEIYMFVPALPIGGSKETSKLEVGKMFEHLCFLAELYDNEAQEV